MSKKHIRLPHVLMLEVLEELHFTKDALRINDVLEAVSDFLDGHLFLGHLVVCRTDHPKKTEHAKTVNDLSMLLPNGTRLHDDTVGSSAQVCLGDVLRVYHEVLSIRYELVLASTLV